VIRKFDEFCYAQSFMNVADEEGPLLDEAVPRTNPARL